MRKERIRKLVGVCKGVDEFINESTMGWYGHMKRINKNRIVVFKNELIGVNRTWRI